ncbi:hypothetical protein BC835DRAFT_1360950 [Cytidiella melzeri]|nr:hypothetical protein BC835DRAFT_1360950 [Cytidiella melzeri]
MERWGRCRGFPAVLRSVIPSSNNSNRVTTISIFLFRRTTHTRRWSSMGRHNHRHSTRCWRTRWWVSMGTSVIRIIIIIIWGRWRWWWEEEEEGIIFSNIPCGCRGTTEQWCVFRWTWGARWASSSRVWDKDGWLVSLFFSFLSFFSLFLSIFVVVVSTFDFYLTCVSCPSSVIPPQTRLLCVFFFLVATPPIPYLTSRALSLFSLYSLSSLPRSVGSLQSNSYIHIHIHIYDIPRPIPIPPKFNRSLFFSLVYTVPFIASLPSS